jgi:hypothetical protein
VQPHQLVRILSFCRKVSVTIRKTDSVEISVVYLIHFSVNWFAACCNLVFFCNLRTIQFSEYQEARCIKIVQIESVFQSKRKVTLTTTDGRVFCMGL